MVVLPFDVCSFEGLSDTDLETTVVEASSDPLDRAVLGLLVLMSAPVGRLAEAQKRGGYASLSTVPSGGAQKPAAAKPAISPALTPLGAIDGAVPDPPHHPALASTPTPATARNSRGCSMPNNSAGTLRPAQSGNRRPEAMSSTAASPHIGTRRTRSLIDKEGHPRIDYVHFDALPMDDAVAVSYGRRAAALVDAGRQPRRRVMDLLIAATPHAQSG